MTRNDEVWRSPALLTALVQHDPQQRLEQTALIELLFLLTAVRGVPTGYRFRLHNYGPFDAAVPSDIDYAARLNALSVEIEKYPNGYGYRIELGPEAQAVMDRARPFLNDHQRDIDWVTRHFAGRSGDDRSLSAAIVYANREQGASSPDEIVKVVREIKPRFSEESIRRETRRLQEIKAAACWT